MKMTLRLFESGLGYDSIEIQVSGKDRAEIIQKACLVIETLYKLTDIEEIGIGSTTSLWNRSDIKPYLFGEEK